MGTDNIPSIFDDSPEQEPLRINHIQMEGTHNSYHVEPIFSPTREYMYTHEDLDIQATDQGVRQFEIDVWWDVREGLRVYLTSTTLELHVLPSKVAWRSYWHGHLKIACITRL